MIVKMLKMHVVARREGRQRLLEALQELGVVHLAPIDPAKAVAPEETLAAIDRLGRAAQVLAELPPAGQRPDVRPAEAAEEVLRIHREAAERRSRLAGLHQQIEQLAFWGDVTIGQIEALREAGVEVRVFSVPTVALGEIGADCVQPVGREGGSRTLVAVVRRGAEPELPDGCEPVELPARDRPSLRAEAAEIEKADEADQRRLEALAHLAEELTAERDRLREQARFTVASESGMTDRDLYAVQGWVPAGKADAVAEGLARAGIDAGVQTLAPTEEDEPPTLIRYSRWVRPIKALFDVLGTFPGYDEYDLSPFFLIALPLFAAMLIGDAGYGLLFLAIPLLFYRKLSAAAGTASAHLLMIVGAMTLIWGVLTANYFGITPESVARAGGYITRKANGDIAEYHFDRMAEGTDACARIGTLMRAPALLWVAKPKDVPKGRPEPWGPRDVLIAVSFLLGTLHLVWAHLRRMAALFPDQRFLAQIGWCLILVAMLSVIWLLFFRKRDQWSQLLPVRVMLILLVAGGALAILFSAPARNPLKRVGVGLAASLLPLLSTFSDTMSYIRLMAVGLASYYIASAFNGLGATLAEAITWYAVVPVLVIVFGHTLNIALAVIAIFAHGVRLNMLEFSSNAGVQWAGYPYEPFAGQQVKES